MTFNYKSIQRHILIRDVLDADCKCKYFEARVGEAQIPLTMGRDLCAGLIVVGRGKLKLVVAAQVAVI